MVPKVFEPLIFGCIFILSLRNTENHFFLHTHQSFFSGFVLYPHYFFTMTDKIYFSDDLIGKKKDVTLVGSVLYTCPVLPLCIVDASLSQYVGKGLFFVF